MDKAICICQLGCGHNLMLACFWVSKADVVADRTCKQVGILKNHAQGAAKICLTNAFEGNSVVGDASFFNIVESSQKVCNGGFSRTSGTNQGHLLSRLCNQIDVVEHCLFCHVAKADVVKDNLSF